MGCWEETCALTLLPIYQKQPCVVVVMNETYTNRYRKADHPSIIRLEHNDNCCDVEAIHTGTYSEYGWINEVPDVMAPAPQQGNGNEIVYVDRPLSQRRFTMFFHVAVWEDAVKAGMEEAKRWEGHRLSEIKTMDDFHRKYAEEDGTEYKPSIFAKKPPSAEAVMLHAVARVAYWTRRDLFASEQFHGSQAWENQHYNMLNAHTQKLLAKMKDRDE